MSLSDADALEQLRLERDDVQAKLRAIAAADPSSDLPGAKPNASGVSSVDDQGYYALLQRRLDSLNQQIQDLNEKLAEQEAYNSVSKGCV